MSIVAIGDLARHLVLQRGQMAAKTRLDRLSGELASGQRADPAAGMAGDSGQLAAITSGLARISGWQGAIRAVDLRLQTMQATLAGMIDLAQGQRDALLLAGDAMSPAAVRQAGHEARLQLDAMLGMLNATAGGRSVFAGTTGDRPAVGTADELLAVLRPLVVGAATADAAFAAIYDWFMAPDGFATQFYQGGAARPAFAIGPGLDVADGLTARDPAILDALAGVAAAALAGEDLPAVGTTARQLLARAGQQLTTATGGVVATAARIGRVQEQVAQAATRNAAQQSALEIARSGLLAADPYQTTVELEQAEQSLQLIHLLTARLQRLGLAEVLR